MVSPQNIGIKPETGDILSDNELIILIREENQERYAEIIGRYQGKLFAYLYRLIGNRDEAEDLLQDVFIKAFRNLHSYDSTRKFSSWIYRIAHNEAVNFIKRKSLKRFISWEDVSSTKDKLESCSQSEDGADNQWIRKESIAEVNEAINKLPIKYKQVLLLRYFSDKSYEEISEILGKPVNTVGTLINRAKRKLSEEMIKIEENKKNHGRKKE
ncbi:MAG TPA: RNA polymerase sigma factor SigW [Candidatus Moranbacteria bacterium]|nr:RNA polymerase sigma factor SigW [Candidatus Moranbacteria bacterium]